MDGRMKQTHVGVMEIKGREINSNNEQFSAANRFLAVF
jgi:hypothetical protein